MNTQTRPYPSRDSNSGCAFRIYILIMITVLLVLSCSCTRHCSGPIITSAIALILTAIIVWYFFLKNEFKKNK